MNAVVTVLKNVGMGLLKLATMGAIHTSTNALVSKNKEMSNDFNGQIARGYDYYAQPKIDKGMQLIKGKKQ